MTETIEAQDIYCPECDSDYMLSWSDTQSQMYVICDCDGAEEVATFVKRFEDEYTETHTDKMFQ